MKNKLSILGIVLGIIGLLLPIVNMFAMIHPQLSIACIVLGPIAVIMGIAGMKRGEKKTTAEISIGAGIADIVLFFLLAFLLGTWLAGVGTPAALTNGSGTGSTGSGMANQRFFKVSSCDSASDKLTVKNTGENPISQKAEVYKGGKDEKIGKALFDTAPQGKLSPGEEAQIETTADLKKGKMYEVEGENLKNLFECSP